MNYIKLPKIRVHLFGYIFSPNWLPTVATVVLFCFLCGLGSWQLQRAAEKRLIEREFSNPLLTLNIEELKKTDGKSLQYRQLEVVGHFDNQHVMFLDNKIYHQQIGYHVFVPFILEGTHRALLVNRGFIPSGNRRQLPSPPLLEGALTLNGLIYVPSRKAFTLKKESMDSQWPLVLQMIDLPQIQKRLGYSLYPFYLLAKDPGTPLIQDWHPVNFPAYRHTGYAIQWFLLALTLIVIYVSLNTSRVNQ